MPIPEGVVASRPTTCIVIKASDTSEATRAKHRVSFLGDENGGGVSIQQGVTAYWGYLQALKRFEDSDVTSLEIQVLWNGQVFYFTSTNTNGG
jgi:hypothetical protein